MLNILYINARAAGTLTVKPTDWATLDFVDIKPGEGSSIQVGLYVVASGTIPWNINAKYDYFKLDGSTAVIPYSDATYTILKTPCDELVSRPIPWNLETIYTSSATEFTTKGTTVTISINVNPEKGIRPGKYRSSLHVELGGKL